MKTTDETEGRCLWCGQAVTDQRKASGSKTRDLATENGDYGCDRSPETTADGVGDHALSTDALFRAAPTMRDALKALLNAVDPDDGAGRVRLEPYFKTPIRKARAALKAAGRT